MATLLRLRNIKGVLKAAPSQRKNKITVVANDRIYICLSLEPIYMRKITTKSVY